MRGSLFFQPGLSACRSHSPVCQSGPGQSVRKSDPVRRGVAPMPGDKRPGSGPPGKPEIVAVPARPPARPHSARRKTSAAYSLSLHPVFSRLLLCALCARASSAPRLTRAPRTCCITCSWFRLFLRTCRCSGAEAAVNRRLDCARGCARSPRRLEEGVVRVPTWEDPGPCLG